MTKQDDEHLTEERRKYCELCKKGTEKGISAACSKGTIAMRICFCLLGVCFFLSGVAWSAKADVKNMKDKVNEIHADQKKMNADMGKVVGFIDLLKNGKIKIEGP